MTKFLNISTDNTLGGVSPSDETVSSQKAIKEYADGLKTDWYGTCSTAAATQTKVVDCTGFVLTTGASVRVKFTNAQSYNGQPNLNVNGTGVIPVILDSGNVGIRYIWKSGEVVAFTYDGTSWVMEDAGIATTSYYGITKLATTATSTSTSTALTPASLDSLVQGMIEPYAIYSTSSTYAVGDRVRYNYQAWECNTAIDTAEAWNASHWTAIDPVQTQLDNKVTKDSSSSAKAYGTTSAGVETTWKVSSSASTNTLAYRSTNGVLQVGTPTADAHAATKKYVDDSIPTVNDATITITQGGVTKGSFTLNQSSAQTIALDAGGGGGGSSNIPYGTSDSAADATEKTVSIPELTALNVGQIIIVQPSITSTVANSTIKLNNFTAYPMLYAGSAITTSTDSYVWRANTPTMWRFDGTNWVFLSHGYDFNTTYTSMNAISDNGQYTAGSGNYAITRYSLIMQKADMTWEKVTATNKTYTTGTTKSVNTNGFRLNQIRYYSTTTILANGALSATNIVFSQAASVDMRYSTNCGGTTDWAIGDYIYLVGTLGVDGLFYLDTTTWWSKTLPNTNDGKLYIRLGLALEDTGYTMSFFSDRPIFYHDGTGIKEYKVADNKQDKLTAGDGIDITSNVISATGVKNKNTAAGATNPVYDWVGTLAEYETQAVATNHPDWVCYITDDCEATAYQAYTQSQCNNLFVQKGHQVIDFQEPNAGNNYTWYRKYADGWVEQGGVVDNTSTGYQSFNLPVEMASAHFDLQVTRKAGTSTTVINVWGQDPTYSGSTTTATFYASGNTGIFWEVKGMAA